MKNKIVLVFLAHIISLTICFGQKGQISGHVISNNGDPIAYAKVIIKPSNKTIYTNINGYFLSPRLVHNKYFITITSNSYSAYEDSVELSSNKIEVKFMLRIQKETTLKEIEVTRKKEENFFIRKMKAIEGYTITQGKKTEVISLEQLDANKATNSSRQIFSRIPGLNIWESDDAESGGEGVAPP